MGDSLGSLIYFGILLVAIGGYFFTQNRPNLNNTLQMALVWGLIFMGGMAVYGLWSDIMGPGNFGRTQHTETTITVPRSPDGHYYLDVTINGEVIEFLVDTGATDVVLTKNDAARVGIDVENLAFLGTANTANGPVPIARTRVDRVQVGDFTDRRILVSVNGGEMFSSLLGMTYLGRYDRIEISGNSLVLHR